LLVGVLMHDFRIDRIMLSTITVDGLDATDRLLEMVKDRHLELDVLFLPSVSYGGFNLMDVKRINAEVGVPVVIVIADKPTPSAVKAALKRHFPDWELRWDLICKAGSPVEVNLAGGSVHICASGISVGEAIKLVKRYTVFGKCPEPLRVARIIAHGLSRTLPVRD